MIKKSRLFHLCILYSHIFMPTNQILFYMSFYEIFFNNFSTHYSVLGIKSWPKKRSAHKIKLQLALILKQWHRSTTIESFWWELCEFERNDWEVSHDTLLKSNRIRDLTSDNITTHGGLSKSRGPRSPNFELVFTRHFLKRPQRVLIFYTIWFTLWFSWLYNI